MPTPTPAIKQHLFQMLQLLLNEPHGVGLPTRPHLLRESLLRPQGPARHPVFLGLTQWVLAHEAIQS
jgi:hypothetical protein